MRAWPSISDESLGGDKLWNSVSDRLNTFPGAGVPFWGWAWNAFFLNNWHRSKAHSVK